MKRGSSRTTTDYFYTQASIESPARPATSRPAAPPGPAIAGGSHQRGLLHLGEDQGQARKANLAHGRGARLRRAAPVGATASSGLSRRQPTSSTPPTARPTRRKYSARSYLKDLNSRYVLDGLAGRRRHPHLDARHNRMYSAGDLADGITTFRPWAAMQAPGRGRHSPICAPRSTAATGSVWSPSTTRFPSTGLTRCSGRCGPRTPPRTRHRAPGAIGRNDVRPTVLMSSSRSSASPSPHTGRPHRSRNIKHLAQRAGRCRRAGRALSPASIPAR